MCEPGHIPRFFPGLIGAIYRLPSIGQYAYKPTKTTHIAVHDAAALSIATLSLSK
jgi:hypothetical protein